MHLNQLGRAVPIVTFFALLCWLDPVSALNMGQASENLGTSSAGSVAVRATLYVFIAHDCPISSSYAPEIQRIFAAYAMHGIVDRLVFAEPGFTPHEAAEYAAEYGYHCRLVTSGWKSVVRTLGATTTPEAAVVAPNGELLYRGCIDNLYADLGVRRSQATSHNLRDALNEIISGHPVAVPRTTAVGCSISLFSQSNSP